jgi:Mn-containing catalase
MSSIAFFDLLLEQFKGAEGELPMATTYLTQATIEDNPAHKAALKRIAKEKIENARVLASILLALSKGHIGPLPGQTDRTQFDQLLNDKGITSNYLTLAEASAERTAEAAYPQDSALHLDMDVDLATGHTHYLASNIATEERQIRIYEKLCFMTSNAYFISALNRARNNQIKHRDEFVRMLRKITN